MKRIAFIGCGNMGEALLKGLLNKRLFKRSAIMVSDARPSRRRYIRRAYKVCVLPSNLEAAGRSDIILLAVKPQDAQKVLGGISAVAGDRLIISIAAGITTGHIRKLTGAKRIIRVMPNTPALAGCGITAISGARGTKASDTEIARKIFSCVGEAILLRERYINLVTAVSGSGPAYFFLLTEAMIDSAVSSGLKRCAAEKLALQTAFGSAMLQKKTGLLPSKLRENVTSRGGTTEAALKVFKMRGFENIVGRAIAAAIKKAEALSE